MKSLVLHGANDLRIEESVRQTPGPGQVEVSMEAGGICGSDLHYFSHGGFGSVRLKEPMILGHEVAGSIVALGDGVTGLRVGQRVAVSPSRPCLTCNYCQSGQHNHCLNMRFYGSAMPFPHIQGAFRQSLVADAAQCVPADGLSPGEAAMAEPLAVCLHAVKQAGDLLGKRVLVTGCGPIGLLTILAARRAGAAQIVATGLTKFTVDFAARNGADEILNMKEDPEGLAKYEVDKGHFDVLFECAGVAEALAGAVPVMRPGGIIVQVGLGGDMTVPMQMLTVKELQLRGSFRFHDMFPVGVKFMQDGLINVGSLITQTVPLEHAVDGFHIAGDRTKAMKVNIDFRS